MSPTTLFRAQNWAPRRVLQNNLGTAIIVFGAAFLRFFSLDHLKGLIFDENYYVHEAIGLRVAGYELQWPTTPGPVTLYLDQPAGSVHPPFAKWVIAFFIGIFGQNEIGFRMGSAIAGLTIVVTAMICVWIMTKNQLWANLAGLLLGLDSFALSMSRIALLDGIMTAFAMLGFLFVLLHLQKRSRDSRFYFFRSWIWFAAMFFGLAIASKWSAAPFAIGALLVVVGFEFGLFTTKPRPSKPNRGWRSILAALQFFIVGLATYLVTWTGWFIGKYSWGSYLSDYPDLRVPPALSWLPMQWHPFILHHIDMFIRGGDVHSNHAGLSPAWQWPLMLKPLLFGYFTDKPGAAACHLAQTCVTSFGTLSNPMLWYPAVLAVLALVWFFIRSRNLWMGSLLITLLTAYLPWLVMGRDEFFFYAIEFLPLMTLSLVLVLKHVMDSSEEKRYFPAVRFVTVSYFVAAALAAILFLPFGLGVAVPEWYWNAHLWLEGWGRSSFQIGMATRTS